MGIAQGQHNIPIGIDIDVLEAIKRALPRCEAGIATANGTTIRAESFYAREDGSSGALGELIFETDRGATQYLGDNRVAANDNWAEEPTAMSWVGVV